MRVLLPLLVISACTLGNNAPVLRVPEPDPDRMSSATLDKQDPGADTSQNRVLSRSEWRAPSPFEENLLGCLSWMKCDSGGRGDASGLVLVGAIVFVLRRRRNTVET